MIEVTSQFWFGFSYNKTTYSVKIRLNVFYLSKVFTATYSILLPLWWRSTLGSCFEKSELFSASAVHLVSSFTHRKVTELTALTLVCMMRLLHRSTIPMRVII